MTRFLQRHALVVGVAAIVFGVWFTSFHGRSEIVRVQRQGCERGKLDRQANARAWRAASVARYRDDDFVSGWVYADVAWSLEQRSRIDCRVAFGDPGPFSFAHN